jgi:hypothetical protein
MVIPLARGGSGRRRAVGQTGSRLGRLRLARLGNAGSVAMFKNRSNHLFTQDGILAQW